MLAGEGKRATQMTCYQHSRESSQGAGTCSLLWMIWAAASDTASVFGFDKVLMAPWPQVAYLASTLFLDSSSDLIVLIVNTLTRDLTDDNMLIGMCLITCSCLRSSCS